MQGTQVWFLVQEDSTWHGATKPMSQNHWGPLALEPVLHNKRSHLNEKPMHHNERVAASHHTTREKHKSNNDDPA